MGGLASRHNAGVEEVDISSTNAYRYPPKSGCYFGSHFFMGGQRFDTMQPEAYLFGPNSDLNFLGNRPVPFPYPAPQPNEPTKTLKSLVNIRKDSLRFVKVPEDELEEKKNTETEQQDAENGNQDKATQPVDNSKTEDTGQVEKKLRYNIEFTFDTDVRCAITIYYFATEEISNGQAVYHPRSESMNSETYHYKRGANQIFSQSTHIIEPSQFAEEEWQYNPDKEQIPVVIQCVVEEEEHRGHSHMTFATVDHASDGGWQVKPLKQKQMVDGLCYLLQEIYGIENKTSAAPKDEEIDDSGSECIVCMSDIRDTLILPCRHLCLCNSCADSLRYQANNCPICRKTFHALLQIRALRKKPTGVHQPNVNDNEDNGISQEGVPPGYEAVALLDALNGPNSPPAIQTTVMSMGPDGQPTRPNQLSSGEESPSLKRSKRQGSTKSAKSKESTPVSPSDAETPTVGDGSSTPKMAINSEIPEPVKVPEAQSKVKAKSLTKGGQKAVADSVEMVNEVDIVKDGKISENRSVTPPPDYEDVEGAAEMTSPTSVKPAAHATVMYSRPEDVAEEDRPEIQPLVSLPSQVVDPDNPNDSSGSSYSSTCSNKVLLSRPSSPTKLDDKPVV